MIIHFDTIKLAIEHLAQYGWRKIKNGNYVSKDGTCVASVHPASGEFFCIFYREI